MYLCPTCGAGLTFNPKTQKLLCKYCRKQYVIKKSEEMKTSEAKEVEDNSREYTTYSYKCSHCGADLLTTDETISTFCSFCRSGTIIKREAVKRRSPDFIIPFAKTKEECKDIYVNKIKKAFFAPKNMIDTQEVEKIRGIYMPYWIYSYEKHGMVSGKGSKYSHRSEDYIYYSDYSISTKIDAECYGISHDAASDFSDRLSESISPFNIREKKEFSPGYLSGYYADNEDVDSYNYHEIGEKIASKHISNQLSKEKEFRRYGVKPEVSLNMNEAELALFPVYFLSTKNRKGDRISYAVINGQNGKIAADIPIDAGKFIFASLILSVVLFFVLNLFLSISIYSLIACSVLFNIMSLVILINERNGISKRETEFEKGKIDQNDILNENFKKSKEKSKKRTKEFKRMKKIDDTLEELEEGNNELRETSSFVIRLVLFMAAMIIIPIIYTYVSFLDYKISFPTFGLNRFYVGMGVLLISLLVMIIKTIINPKKDRSTYKSLLGIILTITVLIIRPASDMYYYVSALFSICMSILSFYNIIEKQNELTLRKLPQLGKRGGDENA